MIKLADQTIINTIARRAYNVTARQIAAEGVTLTHEQADDLGEEAIDWLRARLGLRVTETDRGVECVPTRPADENALITTVRSLEPYQNSLENLRQLGFSRRKVEAAVRRGYLRWLRNGLVEVRS